MDGIIEPDLSAFLNGVTFHIQATSSNHISKALNIRQSANIHISLKTAADQRAVKMLGGTWMDASAASLAAAVP